MSIDNHVTVTKVGGDFKKQQQLTFLLSYVCGLTLSKAFVRLVEIK